MSAAQGAFDEKMLQMAILEYLTELKNRNNDEGFDVALECLSDSFKLSLQSADDVQQYSARKLHTLLECFQAGRKAIASADPKLPAFMASLENAGFFKGVVPGSLEYDQRVKMAKERYEAKYKASGASATPASAPAPAASSAESKQPAPAAPSHAAPTAEQKAQAEKHKNEGNEALKAHDSHRAVKAYDAAIALDPTNPVYFTNRGQAYLNISDYDRCIEDCKAAVKLDPKYAKAWNRLGRAYLAQDDEQAIEAFKKGIETATDATTKAAAEAGLREAEDYFSGPTGGAGADPMASMFGQQGGGGGLDINALLNNPDIAKLAQSFMGGGGAPRGGPAAASGDANAPQSEFMRKVMADPDLARLRTDPDMGPVFQEIERDGPMAAMRHMNNPTIMAKIQPIIAKFMGGQ